jgi:biotin synthase
LNRRNRSETRTEESAASSRSPGDELLVRAADAVRRRCLGNDVHLRGIIEFSNHCVKNCHYCGLRRDNLRLGRYRMNTDEIMAAGAEGARLGLKTLVLQSGEDPFYSADMLGHIIATLKEQHDVAITLSVGDRSKKEYKTMKEAGADRYLLKHETADAALFERFRPGTRLAGRVRRLEWLKELGYQVGSGMIVGLPGQTFQTLIDDILLMQGIGVEMAGIGPFIPHPDTPLRSAAPGSADLTLKVLALARLALPFAHLPATTALATMHPTGRELALAGGANVVMPDITPLQYKRLYEIYPNKACVSEDAGHSVSRIRGMIIKTGRTIATGHGDGPRRVGPNTGSPRKVDHENK